eukprot:COSAG03_NODE_9505_length_714_cov_1.585366_1_plen_89_part_01
MSSNFGPGSLGGLPQTEKTIASMVKPLGYRTLAVGKWHMGVKAGHHPLDHGYDEFLGLPESNDYGCTGGSSLSLSLSLCLSLSLSLSLS